MRLAVSFLLAALCAGRAPDPRPHVLFIVSDDQRADTIGALGYPAIRTPNLDGLARSGLVFRNAYCFGANMGAVCTPSRNMFLSGRVYFRWKGPQAPPDGPSFPTAMKAAGYETYHHGKRGNTSPAIQALFDHNKYVKEGQTRASGEPGKEIVDDAIAFLGSRDAARPLFMYLALDVPHDPRVAAEKYMALYRREEIPLPKDYLPLHPFNNGEMAVRDEQLAPWPRTEDAVRKHLHDYYAVITAMDGHLGRLFAAMREKGLYDRTIIVFTSDHGLAIGSHGLFGKQNLYEAGMKPPFVVAGPGIPKGETAALAYLHDIFPTVCDLVGAKIPDGLDGRSLKPVIEGKAKGVRDRLFLSYRECMRAVRDSRWKLIRYPRINRSQLFDLESDPHETKDLAALPEHAGRVKEMMEQLAALQKEYGDAAPLSVDNPDPAEFDFTKVKPAGKGKGNP
jgi:arylsulfatase A-like enzyme